MSRYIVESPDEPERGIRVTCEEHGESEEFPVGHHKEAFYCEFCGYEMEVALRDAQDWKDTGEMC